MRHTTKAGRRPGKNPFAPKLFAGAMLLSLASLGMQTAAAEQALAVSTQAASELYVFPNASAPASVISLNNSLISAQVGARVVDIPVSVGQVVAAGAVLARLDDSDYELQLKQAQAALRALDARIELAEFQLSQTQRLADTGDVSEERLKQRRAEVNGLLAEREGQQARLARARTDLERTRVRAPFRGVVTERLAQVGELLNIGSPVARLLDSENLEVSARIRSEDAAALAQAREIAFSVQGKRYPLQVRAVTPAVDNRDRSQEVRLNFADERALPGSAGRLSWRSPVAHMPAEMLVRREGILGVFVLTDTENPRARFVALEHAQEGRPAPAGLAPEQRIITDGRFRLQDGDPVTVR